jgi:hypothetical protein
VDDSDKIWKEIWEQTLLLTTFWPIAAAVGLSGYMVRKVRKTFARSLVWSGACGTAGCLACAGSLLSSPGSFQKAFWIGLAVAFMMGLSGTRNFPELLGLAIRVLSALKDESKQTKKSDGE